MPVNPDPTLRPPLDNDRLRTAMAEMPDLVAEVVTETASTNALLTQRAIAGAAEGLAIVAEHQTAGRGRLDRQWSAPAGSGLTFSLLLRPTVSADRWSWLPLLVGYAVDDVLKGAGYRSSLKWPNDVLIEGRKVAGILVERIDTPQGPAAVVGVGLNTHLASEELPVDTATALSLESSSSGATPDRTDLLVDLLVALLRSYSHWEAGGESAAQQLAADYARACVTVGQHVRVDLPDGSVLTGLGVGIDSEGALIVRSADGPAGSAEGTEHRVGAGDVVHVRPSDRDR